ncbi:MAG: hypothetical protein RL641_13 [Candidatus Parcubacteria bacterium]|jgi:hypothetical protein
MKTKRFFTVGATYFLAIWMIGAMVLGGAVGGISLAMAHDQENDTEHDQNNELDNQSGSIRICKVVLDSNGLIADVDAVSGGSFTIPGLSATTTLGPSAPDILETTVITTQLEFNSKIFDSSLQNDAECVTYENLAFGNYYYGAEVISDASNWEVPVYHDAVGEYVYTTEFFHTYSGELFDENIENDGDAYHSANGHILIDENQPSVTLVVINTMKPDAGGSDDEPADNGQGGSGSGGGSGGEGNGNGGQGGNNGNGSTNQNPAGGSTGGTSGGTSGGSVSGSGYSAPARQGQVLGESTSCGEYLKTYLRRGYKNDAEEVKKLQTFLNKELGLSLAVSGTFDQDTEDAVRLFQSKYGEKVLKPWSTNHSTGIVHLTTRAQINNLSCETLKQEIPRSLINWKKHPATSSIPKI